MPKKIVFFNYYHNGDIHASRGFIHHIIRKVNRIDPNIQFSYGHKNAIDILADVPNLSFDHQALSVVGNDHSNLVTVGDTTYINTWYAQQNFKYMNHWGVTLDTLYAAFNDTCKSLWGFDLSNISDDPLVFFPFIDYEKFYINEAKNWLAAHPEKKIFISNGEALSGQSHNFAISPLVEKIARVHTDKTFILSNNEATIIDLPNVFYSRNIIKKPGNDLNENAFISEHCHAIIGRASGSFAFSQTQNNMIKRNCNMLCFTNLIPQKEGKFWLSDLLQDKINYSAKVTVTNALHLDVIQNLMETQL
jgi:hypothetical protein